MAAELYSIRTSFTSPHVHRSGSAKHAEEEEGDSVFAIERIAYYVILTGAGLFTIGLVFLSIALGRHLFVYTKEYCNKIIDVDFEFRCNNWKGGELQKEINYGGQVRRAFIFRKIFSLFDPPLFFLIYSSKIYIYILSILFLIIPRLIQALVHFFVQGACCTDLVFGQGNLTANNTFPSPSPTSKSCFWTCKESQQLQSFGMITVIFLGAGLFVVSFGVIYLLVRRGEAVKRQYQRDRIGRL